MPQALLLVVEILPVKVEEEVISPDAQPPAKLLKQKSKVRQNKRHWDKLKNLERFIWKEDE
jgi:hypothetical protein